MCIPSTNGTRSLSELFTPETRLCPGVGRIFVEKSAEKRRDDLWTRARPYSVDVLGLIKGDAAVIERGGFLCRWWLGKTGSMLRLRSLGDAAADIGWPCNPVQPVFGKWRNGKKGFV